MTDRERWMTCTDPAWMLAALGDAADERRLLIAMRTVQSYWDAKTYPHQWKLRSGIEAKNWLEIISIIDDKSVPAFACNAIRCLWPSPFIERERVECDKCSGGFIRDRYFADNDKIDPICKNCNGEGFMPCMLYPLIDPRWRTPLVMDLARRVMGDAEKLEHALSGIGMQGIGSGTNAYMRACVSDKYAHNPDLSPILSDAMMDAGCDLPEIIEHLKGDRHGPECWVIKMLLGES